MFTLLKRLLGLDKGDDADGDPQPSRGRKGSATGHLFTKDSPAMRRTAETGKPRPSSSPAKAPPRNDFDPYNTGKFDRGASWEKISKNQR